MGLTDCFPPSGQSASLGTNQEGRSNIEHGKREPGDGGRASAEEPEEMPLPSDPKVIFLGG